MISLIIAAYNIEEYIERCLISCINQTFKDVEIIVVNDGSTDSTLEKINKCSKNDRRVKIINKKNCGLIEARKSGFEVTTGEYILFIDGDDWLRLDAVELLYKKAKEKNYDIVLYRWILKYDNNKEELIEFLDNMPKNSNLLELLFQGKVCTSLWCKFIRKDFIVDNNIEFPKNISYGEDVAFSYTLSMYNPQCTTLNKYLYYYFKRSGSLDNGINEKTVEIIQAVTFVKDQLKKNNLYGKYKEEFDYMAFIKIYYNRKWYIFRNNNKISKRLFRGLEKINIEINEKNNQFYMKLFEHDSKKALLVEKFCKKYYWFGYLYYRLKEHNG